MLPVSVASREDLDQLVHDCLPHLYDFTYLQTHPLVDLLVAKVKGPDRIQKFRDVLIDAVDQLLPSAESPQQGKQKRLHHLLYLRYVRQQSVLQTMNALGVSERQFYRDHIKAVQHLSSVLWEQVSGLALPPSLFNDETSEISIETEAQRAIMEGQRSEIDLESLVRGALAPIRPHFDQYQIKVQFVEMQPYSLLDADRTVLRQIIILILSQMADPTMGASHLKITGALVDGLYCLSFSLTTSGTGQAEAMKSWMENNESLQSLTGASSATVEFLLQDGSPVVMLKFTVQQDVILVVDDNPNVLKLLQRYATGEPYLLIGAESGRNVVDLARQTCPRIIILDVMLPGQDGWEILQALKSDPVTCTIPIWICSVLDVSNIAALLGANAYIRKPPGQLEFLQLLSNSTG